MWIHKSPISNVGNAVHPHHDARHLTIYMIVQQWLRGTEVDAIVCILLLEIDFMPKD